jgi:hypothetical protein
MSTDPNPDRRFISFPAEVPPWFVEVWSTCHPGSAEEREAIINSMPDELRRDLVGARFEAICYIEVEGDEPIFRGVIYSVPA